MSRYCAKKDVTLILEAAAYWRNVAFLKDGSIFSDKYLWTAQNLEILERHFVQNPDEGGGNFLEKLHQQLEPVAPAAKQLCAEMLWMLLLAVSNVNPPKKREIVYEVWNWSNESLPESAKSYFTDEVLDGVGSGGVGFSNYRWTELAFFINTTLSFKRLIPVERTRLLNDPWHFSTWLGKIPDADARQFRHMLLFLLFPDEFERLFAKGDRRAVALEFSGLDQKNIRKQSPEELDRTLHEVRLNLEKEYSKKEIDYYESPIRERWQPRDEDNDEEYPSGTHEEGDEENRNGEKPPLKEAYAFGAKHGLEREMSDIKKREILKWRLKYDSGVRRGWIIDLFEKNDLFDAFKKEHWPFGNTPRGEKMRLLFLRIKTDYEAEHGPESTDENDGDRPYTNQPYKEEKQLILDHYRKLDTDPDREIRINETSGYMQLPTSETGIHFEWLFKRKEKMLHVAIHFETKSKERNRDLCAAISKHKDTLEEKLKEELHVNPDWTPKGYSSVYIEHRCEPWGDDIATWAAEKMYDFIQLVEPLLSEEGYEGELTEDTLPSFTIDDAVKDIFLPREEVKKALGVWMNKKNLIMQGPPGVGKTFIAENLAYALMGVKNRDAIGRIQFHQSYSYEDFIEGYRPAANGGFELKPGVFKKFCDQAQDHPDDKYVFIIDEINRGNLSKILGELMVLIEGDKRMRKGSDNEQNWAMPLTYSDKPFFVPENIFILGMMNTADRSLSLVDYALRRRFAFMEIKPQFDSSGFKKHLTSRNASEKLILDIINLIGKLNHEIEKDPTLGKGFCVGHSYFCLGKGVKADEAWFRVQVETEIIPLLEEYWFDQPDTVEKWKKELRIN